MAKVKLLAFAKDRVNVTSPVKVMVMASGRVAEQMRR